MNNDSYANAKQRPDEPSFVNVEDTKVPEFDVECRRISLLQGYHK